MRSETSWRPVIGERSVISETGTCLRLIECEPDTHRVVPAELVERVYDFWETARQDIWQGWMHQTDPANLQPRVRPLNQRVADFIRANPPTDHDDGRVTYALDVLESPWPRREEALLRGWFESDRLAGSEKSRDLVERVHATGIEPYRQAPLLPPITLDDVQLICWMAVAPAEGSGAVTS